jgi:hypothetical protein
MNAQFATCGPLGLLRGDIGGLDYLAPFFRFLSDKLSKVSRRGREWRAAESSNVVPDFWVTKAGINLLVELVDDVGGCFSRRNTSGVEGKAEVQGPGRNGAHDLSPTLRIIAGPMRLSWI